MDANREQAGSGFSPFVFAAVIIAAALLLFGENYLIFHTFAELFTALIGLVIFTIAWHTRRVATSDYLTVLGMAFLPISLVTIMHALSYRGMPLLPAYDVDLPTQLWLIARSLQASAFLLASLYLGRTLRRPDLVLAGFTAAGGALTAAAFAGLLPAAFIEGQGLTAFKIGTEYAVIAGSAIAALALVRAGARTDGRVRGYLLASVLCTIFAELLFTLYADPLGPLNRLGHVAHLAAFSFIYFALVRASLETPFDTLFRRLAQREQELSRALADEHQIAETLQNVMSVQPQSVSGLEVGHRYLPAPGPGRIGGDFYDVFPIDANVVGFSIGDVCGKGLRAAGVTLKARSAIRALALSAPDPSEVLERANNYLVREIEDDSFVTAIYGTIDMRDGHVRLAIAGHPDPVVCGRPELMPPPDVRSHPLGVLEALGAQTWDLYLADGESLVLVTDGVLDTEGESDRFGDERLHAMLHDLACAGSAEHVAERVVSALMRYGNERLGDDVAVVALRFSAAEAAAA